MTTPAPHTFDARPLTDPVDPKAVSAFIREMRARRGRRGISPIGKSLIVLAGAIVILAVIVGATVAKGTTPWVWTPVVVLFFLFTVASLVAFIAFRRGRVARFRLNRFAAANGMTYADRIDDPALPGTIFNVGRTRHSDRAVRSSSPRFVEFGNYEYVTGFGRFQATTRWGYVAIKLDGLTPNIVRDPRGNYDLLRSLPSPPRQHQRISLEMVGDWFFLYSKRKISTPDPETWAWLFATVQTLIVRFDQLAGIANGRARQASVDE